MVKTRRGAETAPSPSPMANDLPPTPSKPTRTTTAPFRSRRTPPFLPTPLERIILTLFPALLLFGTLFSLLSPETRSAPYDPVSQSHAQDPAVAPSYFARKSNVFNVFFVKRGWGWATVAVLAFVATHPALRLDGDRGVFGVQRRRVQAVLRWMLVTGWWFVVTQWFFGPPIIDRGFRWTGGRCELAEREVVMGDTSVGEMVTAVACKAAGGRWKGGHDISGHVFLLVLGSAMLMQEVGWAAFTFGGRMGEERNVVMADGAVKSASVEKGTNAAAAAGAGKGLRMGVGGNFALGVLGFNLWMLLMTAIYFHTWFEKLTGLVTALMGVYAVYYVPRFVPAVRQVIGMPGV